MHPKEQVLFYKGHHTPNFEQRWDSWETVSCPHQRSQHSQSVAVDQVQKIDPTTHAYKYSLRHVHCCASVESSSQNISIKQSLVVFSRQDKPLWLHVGSGLAEGRQIQVPQLEAP